MRMLCCVLTALGLALGGPILLAPILLAPVLLPAVLLPAVQAAPEEGAADGAPPVAAMQRLELKIVYWEGTFGTYLVPEPGAVLVVDLDRVGTKELTTLRGEPGNAGHFMLAHLDVKSDVTVDDTQGGWMRRVLLTGRQTPDSDRSTTMELLIQYQVAAAETQPDGRQVPLHGNTTNISMRLHTLRDEGTITEYARCTAYHDRDHDVRIPAPAGG